jgi:hypothetical protein
MGWLIWVITYFAGQNGSSLDCNPWFITLCFFIGSISFTVRTSN